MATQGKKTTFLISTDSGSSYTAIDDIDDVTFSPKKDLLDKTKFGGSGAKDKFVGLADGQIQANGNWNGSDTGQAALRTAYTNETTVRLKVLFDGTAGYTVDGIVPTFNIKSTTAGKVTVSYTFDWTALPTAV